jgi:hypothetical protein
MGLGKTRMRSREADKQITWKGKPHDYKCAKARGRPFKPGNPGRPPGSKNKITHFGVKEVYPL